MNIGLAIVMLVLRPLQAFGNPKKVYAFMWKTEKNQRTVLTIFAEKTLI
ncbi:MAG: hypothetical protein ABIW34_03595 [Ginsengibacter sp.]